MWTFKYSGKAVTLNVKLPAYTLTQTITTKSKVFVLVSFTVT